MLFETGNPWHGHACCGSLLEMAARCDACSKAMEYYKRFCSHCIENHRCEVHTLQERVVMNSDHTCWCGCTHLRAPYIHIAAQLEIYRSTIEEDASHGCFIFDKTDSTRKRPKWANPYVDPDTFWKNRKGKKQWFARLTKDVAKGRAVLQNPPDKKRKVVHEYNREKVVEWLQEGAEHKKRMAIFTSKLREEGIQIPHPDSDAAIAEVENAWKVKLLRRKFEHDFGKAELHGPTTDKIKSGEIPVPGPVPPDEENPDVFNYHPLEGDGPEDEQFFYEWIASTDAFKNWLEAVPPSSNAVPDVDFDTELRGSCFPRPVSDVAESNLNAASRLDLSTDGIADPVLVEAIAAAAVNNPPATHFISEMMKAVRGKEPQTVLASITQARHKAMSQDNSPLDEMAIGLLIHTHTILQKSNAFQAGEYEAAAKIIEGWDPTKTCPSIRSLVVTALNTFEDKFKDATWMLLLRSFCTGMYMSYTVLGTIEDMFDWLMIHIKPAALVAILSTYSGTQASFLAVLVAVLQLYDMFDPELVSSIVTHLGDTLWTLVQKGFAFLTGNPLGPILQAPGDHISLLAALAAGTIIFLFGNLPAPLSKNVRNLLTGATTVMGILKAFQLIYRLLTDWWTRKCVVSLLEQATAVTTSLNNPAVFSQASQLRKLKVHVDKLHEQVLTKLADPQFSSHATSLRALQTSLQTLEQRISVLLAGSHERTPPQMWIFAGPPGIGKTHLVHLIAKSLSKNNPSVFTCQVDHHDGYTGEQVCIWDEFDTDPKAEFVEKTIQMVNNTPMLLNCDLAENKGKMFTSSVILATTNQDTPVLPNYPRAHAFYRRVNIIDVSSPVIDEFMKKNPGVPIPQNLFKADCSHLVLSLRPFLAYTPQGHILNSDKTVPSTKVSLSKLMIKIKTDMPKPELQAPDDAVFQNIYLECEDPVAVCTYLKKYMNGNNGFAVVCLASDMLSNINCVGHRIVCCASKGPTSAGYACKVMDQPPFGTFQDLNTTLNLFPRLPHLVNKNIQWRIFHSAVHLGMNKPPGLGVFHTYTVSSPVDLFTAIKREYGMACTLKWFGGTVKSFFTWDYARFFEEIVHSCFPQERHNFAVMTPVGTYYMFTCGGAQVFYSKEKHRVGRIMPVIFQAHKGLGDILWDLGARLWKFLLSKFAHILSAAAVSTFVSQMHGRPQNPPLPRGAIRQYRGVALTDGEYETWQEYRKSYDPTITADEFVAARDAWKGATATLNTRLKTLADWLRTRSSPVDASGAVLQAPPDLGLDSPYQVLMREDGTPGGWGIHIGHGRWVINNHCWRDGCMILNQPLTKIDHPLASNDIMVTLGPVLARMAELSDNTPVRTWDNRCVSFVQEHTCKVETDDGKIQNVKGWIGLVPLGANKGDCGRPYFDTLGKVCGIHTGFYTGNAHVIISRLAPIPIQSEVTWRGIPVQNSGIALGPLPKGTAFCRSPAWPIKQSWEDVEPTPYGFPDPRCLPTQEKILAEQLEPYVQPPIDLPEVIDQAAAYVYTHLANLLSFLPEPKTETLSQALLRLDLTTSAGPFVPGTKGNYISIICGTPHYDPSSLFGLHIHTMIAKASAGQPLINAYKLALKDELLPTEKAHKKKRLLWGTDCGLTTLAAMVWGPVMDNLKSLVSVSFCAVGCNVHSTYAALLVQRLMGKDKLCLDYSKWDSTMNPVVIRHAVNILCDLAEPGPYTESLRKTLCQPAKGYFMDKVVTTLRGLPSGTPATSVVNSVCHAILFVAGLWKAQDDAMIARDIDPLVNNPIVTYGDDCIYGFAPRNAPVLQNFIDALRSFGLKPTSPDKSPEIRVGERETFLKRDIIPTSDDKIVMALDISSILRQFAYIRGSKTGAHTDVCQNIPTHRKIQIQEALIELTLHGKHIYEKWRFVWEQTVHVEMLDVITDYEHLVQIYNSRYWVGDLTCNEILESSPELILSNRCLKAVLQNPPDKQAAPAAATDGAGGAMSGTGTADGLITGSYTATPAVVGTAGAPIPDPAPLATMGAGMQSGVPQELYGLFVSSTRFTWNTQQPPGTRLGTIYLSPNLHPHLALIWKMYAGWSGSMMVRIMLSAPGVVGGRLLACILPPGISPERVTNPTAYPCSIMDARLCAPLEMTLTDVRTNTYHTLDETNPTCSLSIYVNAPLVNPFSGGDTHLSAVDVTIYVCPAPDFSFCLLMEPRSEQAAYSEMLPKRSSMLYGNRHSERARYLTGFVQFCQAWNHYDVYGTTYGWGDGDPDGFTLFTSRSNGNLNVGEAHAIHIARLDSQTYGRPKVAGWELAPTFPDFAISGAISANQRTNVFGNAYWAGHAGVVMCGVPFTTLSATGFDVYEGGFIALIPCFGSANANDASTGNTAAIEAGVPARSMSGPSGVFKGLSLGTIAGFSVCPSYSISSATTTPFNQAVPVGTPTAVATSGNMMAALGTLFPTSNANTPLTMYHSQSRHTSMYLAENNFGIPTTSMCVFRFVGQTDSFEVGIRPDGYMMIGGSSVVTVDLTQDYDIIYSGMASINTPLVAPRPANSRVVPEMLQASRTVVFDPVESRGGTPEIPEDLEALMARMPFGVSNTWPRGMGNYLPRDDIEHDG